MICVIPARGGSQRIPRKNIKPFHGTPIIAYSIKAALQSNLFSRVIVSTEDDEIARVARHYGADVHVRPANWAVSDPDIGTVDVMRDALNNMDNVIHKLACAIYPCAPFVRPHHLFDSLQIFLRSPSDYQYVVDGSSSIDQGQFYWGMFTGWQRRIPISHAACLKYYIANAIDINTPEDWSRAEQLYEESYL